MKLYGNIEKELKDLQQGLETISAGLDYTSPSYWVNKNGGHLSVAESLGLDFATYVALGGLTGLIKRGVCTLSKTGIKTNTKLLKEQLLTPGYRRYLVNGEWDLLLLSKEVNEGVKDARAFLSSEIKLLTDTHNELLAKRIGLLGFERDEGISRAKIEPKTRKFTLSAIQDAGGLRKALFGDASDDEVIYNIFTGHVKPTAYHEELHRGLLGEGNIFGSKHPELSITKKIDDTNAFENWKVLHLLDAANINDPEVLDYLLQSGELATNMLELGYKAGIKPGTEYPGAKQTLDLLEHLKRRFPEKSYVVDALNKKHPKRIWQALTGRYFVIPGVITASETLKEK